jgi:hypothetical protein
MRISRQVAPNPPLANIPYVVLPVCKVIEYVKYSGA